MYESHFGLTQPPFTLTPNPAFFVGHATHQEALNTLMVAVQNGEGFIKITGEVGTGKTLLCRTFLDLLDAQGAISAYIPNPYVGPTSLLRAIADEFGIVGTSALDQHALIKALTAFLIEAGVDGRPVVLCLDEAQALPIESLEVLRLLTNLETARRKLLQVVLFGQPELDARLAAPHIRQLKQRISFSYCLRPLRMDEITHYLSSRLVIAGYNGAALFDKKAVRVLSRASGGIPRLVNIFANKALLAAFGEGAHAVNVAHVRSAVRDTESAYRPLNLIRQRITRYIVGLLLVVLTMIPVFVWGPSL